MSFTSTKKCLICNRGKKNDTLYWHTDPESGEIWCWCNKCGRGYSIWQYCHTAGINLSDFLKQDFYFQEAKNNEVNKLEFPNWFIPLSNPNAKKGLEYIKSRGLLPEGDMYYDTEYNGVVFPLYFDNAFCGAQTRLIEPWVNEDGDKTKMISMPGTRTGLLFYGWNQQQFVTEVKGVIVTEGAIDALSVQQSLNAAYGGLLKNPWKAIACSGAGATKHHIETIKALKDNGVKVVLAPDTDEAGLLMLKKFKDEDAITHYALTNDTEKDWNSVLLELGHTQFAKWFLKQIRSIL